MQTHADVVVRLSTAMQESVPQVRDPAVELSVQVRIDLGVRQAKLALSPAKHPDARALFDELAQMLVALARRTSLLVVFDEFQSVTTIDGVTALPRTYRADLRAHRRPSATNHARGGPGVAVRPSGERADQAWGQGADDVARGRDCRPGGHLRRPDRHREEVARTYANGGSIYGSAAERLDLSPGAADHARDSLLADAKLRHGGDSVGSPTRCWPTGLSSACRCDRGRSHHALHGIASML